MIRSIFILLVSLTLSGCCDLCKKSSPQIGQLENSNWTLIELNSNPIEGSTITLYFSAPEKMVYGSADCNNFFAGYTLFDNPKRNIRFANVGATRKACPDMKTELDFTQSLPSITRISMESNRLAMIDSLDNLVAVLVKAKRL